MTTDTEEFLEHFGVKGMHWGVRKDENGVRVGHQTAQLHNPNTGNSHTISYNPKKATPKTNADGTVTLVTSHKGEQKSIQRQIDSATKKDPHPDSVRAATAKRTAQVAGTKSLSNAELKALVERMNLEQQYSKLNPKQVGAGERFVKGTGKVVGSSFKGAAQGTSNQLAKTATNIAVKAAFTAFFNSKRGRGAKDGGAYNVVRSAIGA